jgi:hypothetical protein
MASRFLCECGAEIRKNLFSGNKVAFLVPEERLDRDLATMSAEAFAPQITACEIVLVCEACDRLHVLDEHGDKPYRVYVRETQSD